MGVLFVAGINGCVAGDGGGTASPAPDTASYGTGTAHIEVTGITQVSPSVVDMPLVSGRGWSAPNEYFGQHNEIELSYGGVGRDSFSIMGDPSHPTADTAMLLLKSQRVGWLSADAHHCGWSFQEVSKARVIGSLECDMSDEQHVAQVHATFVAEAAASS